MRRRVAVLGAAVLGAGAATAWAPGAEACSSVASQEPAGLDGYPADGAVGVPTNVIPIYDSTRLGYPDVGGRARFVLRAPDGLALPLPMSTPYYWNVALTPSAELEPNTEVHARGEWVTSSSGVPAASRSSPGPRPLQICQTSCFHHSSRSSPH